jgi:GntR family transcriptional regulator
MQIRGLSTYQAIAAAIRADIESGKYPRGSELPGQHELAALYKVNQTTINRALRVLTACGLIISRRGVRSIVMPIPPIIRDAAQRYSKASRERAGSGGAYDSQIKALGHTPRVDLAVERAVPSARVAELLGVPTGEASVIVRRRVMWADDVITQLADSYVAVGLFGDTVLEQIDEGVGGMVSRMAELGHPQVRIVEETVGRPATPEEAAALGINDEQAVLYKEHVGYGSDGKALEVTIHTMPQHLWIDRVEFVID